MKLEVYGTGCAKCERLMEAVDRAAKELNLDFTLEKVSDIQQIVKKGIMGTPAFAIDGTVKTTGKIPSHDELLRLLTAQ
ncbi:thioredoxin family protein [Chrysiogenes arsenatis]|uniref:thioredoxin family protein n=1 Tax=Chrysiogenes arsenatis TaxID=309797 RepID=UPI00041A3C16|nr:thioredoxin family protein [Chrysiogenes arsenatis]